jgi:hypothetical protein
MSPAAVRWSNRGHRVQLTAVELIIRSTLSPKCGDINLRTHVILSTHQGTGLSTAD